MKRSLKKLLELGYKVSYINYDTNYYEFTICVDTENGHTCFYYKSLPKYLKFEHLEEVLKEENEFLKISRISIFWE